MGFRLVTCLPSPSPSVDTHTVFAGEPYQCVCFYEMVAVASAYPHRAHLHVVFRCDAAEVALQNVHVCRIVMYLFAPYGCSDRCAGGVFQHLVRETVTIGFMLLKWFMLCAETSVWLSRCRRFAAWVMKIVVWCFTGGCRSRFW